MNDITKFLIIDNKDYLIDDYRIRPGKFVSDFALVSDIACFRPSITYGTNIAIDYRYVPIRNDYFVKFNMIGRNDNIVPPKIIYKAPKYACTTIGQGTFHKLVYSETYTTKISSLINDFVSEMSAITVEQNIDGYKISSCEFTNNPLDNCYITGYWEICSNDVNQFTGRVVGGGGNTGDNSVYGVDPCLEIPLPSLPLGNVGDRSFNIFTLSGGVEAFRTILYYPPTAFLTVTVSSSSDNSSLTKNILINYYDVSSNIIKVNNQVDNWYVDVSGFMWPNQYLFDQWFARWSIDNLQGDFEVTSANFINRSTNLIGGEYNFNYEQVDSNPVALNEQIDYVRFYFSTPGIKRISFIIGDGSNPNITFTTYELSTIFFNNTSDIGISREEINIQENYIYLSAISFYNNGRTSQYLNSTYPNIKWLYENENNDQVGLLFKNGKSPYGNINLDSPYPATDADYIQVSALQSGFYTISVVNTESNQAAVYNWPNFIPSDIEIKYEYDNCPLNRFVTISAITNFNGKEILYDGLDFKGNPLILKWSWNTSNINAYSAKYGANIRNNGLILASIANPIIVRFTNANSVERNLLSTTFSVSSNIIDIPDNNKSFNLNYDILPKGFELDIGINYETGRLINNTYYRIFDDTLGDFSVNFSGKIKPEDSTGWLSDNEVAELNITQPLKMMWYFNGDENDIYSYGNNAQYYFNATENYHISSITFLVSCLSASPNFGYGHTLSKTVNLRIYKDSFVPNIKNIVFPEYQWRLPNISPTVRSLSLNPDDYWLETPYPSAYGEGKTVNFLATSFSDDYSGPSWDNFYETFSWYFNGIKFVTSDELFEFSLPTQLNTEKSATALVASFKPSILLLNNTLSTYKDDLDGSTKVFKNWDYIDNEIKIVNYETPSSKEILFDINVVDRNTVEYSFTVQLDFPNYSPVRENKNFQTINWDISSDTGVNFSGVTLQGRPYKINLSPSTNIKKLIVTPSVQTKIYIPNQENLGLNYPVKDFSFSLPTEEFTSSIINFELSSSDLYSIVDNSTQIISAFSPTNIEGKIITEYTSYDYNWIVNGVDLGTNTPFTTSIFGYSFDTSSPGYLGPVIPITLVLNNNGDILERTKYLHINPPINLDWRIFSNNVLVKLNDETYFYNDTKGPIPIETFIYKFENKEEYYTQDFGDLLFTSFDTIGAQNLYVTAIDVKGFRYESFFVNIINVVENYNEFIPDQYNGEKISLKNSFDSLKINSNEWVVNGAINSSFKKVYDNLIFLENISTFYETPPFSLIGWYGYYNQKYKWNMSPHDSNFKTISINTNQLKDLVSYRKINEDLIVLGYKKKIEIRENSYETELLYSASERSINDGFVNIKNVLTDSDGRIIILDEINFGTITIYEYNPLLVNKLKFITTWGGYGGPQSKTKFNLANDISIDHNDNLFVADTGNRVIKKFTITGGFLGIISSDLFNSELETEELGTTQNGSVISVSNGPDNVLYALTNNYVVFFDNETNKEIHSFKWTEKAKGLTPVKISASSDHNIFYIVCKEKVAKFNTEGLLIGFIGEFPEEFNVSNQTYTPNYINYFHYDDKTAYLISSNFVIKYADLLTFISIKPKLQNEWWQLKNLQVNKDEFVDYWVYNKVFSRFWENFDLFRNSLLARALYSYDFNNKKVLNLYPRDNIYKPSFTYSKEDILIGVNEIVSSEVINRCLFRLNICATELLDMITSQKVRYRWIDTIKVGNNPTKWFETKSDKNAPIIWSKAIT